MARDLPSGSVTFLFSDIEGSTRLLHELGSEAYAAALAEHRRILRTAFQAEGGVEVGTEGDSFFVAFPTPAGAVRAAAASRDALAAGQIRVRMGLHTGTPFLSTEGYIGPDVHLGARIAAAGHGGQVLLSARTQALVEADVTDLGEHRLKDFSDPILIYQLGSQEFPPLKTIANTNLPRPASSFIGREREVAEVGRLIANGARLVSLIGPAGSGKTRLAIESAASLTPDFSAGVFWVGLAALRDPGLVIEAIGRTLGAKEGVAEHIGQREMLLVVDNLEQVIAAATELAALVESCPNLSVLVTSRELLRVRGEVPYHVSPLGDDEAVSLFAARSGVEAAEPVRQLCRALDNLPLAIELAAARTAVLSLDQILARLSSRLDLLKGGRDADPRQVTLRATIEWSHELLNADEQRLFGRMAVFRSGCTLDAAAAVIDADLDTLQSLVEKSLVGHSGERFWMLEMIRDFAAERLAESDEGPILRRRHADHFLALAEEAEPNIMRESARGESRWLDLVEAEVDNVRAALDWLAAAGEADGQLRLAGALSEFWCARSHIAEGRQRINEALAASREGPTPARAKALSGAAHLARDTGDFATAVRLGEEGLQMHRDAGDAWRAGDALWHIGQAAGDLGDFVRAREAFAEASRLFGEAGDEENALFADRLLSWAYFELGDRDQARQLTVQTLERARSLGNRSLEASLLGAIAARAIEEGRLDEAASAAPQALRIVGELGDVGGVANELCRCAAVLARTTSPETAAALLGASEALHEQSGHEVLPYLAAENARTTEVIRELLDPVAIAAAWERGRALTKDEAVALALEGLDRT